MLLVICVLILLLIGSMLGKNSYVHQHQDNRNLTDDNEIDVEEVSDKKGNEDKEERIEKSEKVKGYDSFRYKT